MRVAKPHEADRVAKIEELAAIDRRIVKEWGDRCSDRELGCITCQVWAARDVIARAFEITDEL